LRPEHVSTYSLTPAEGTPLWDWLERGEITLPDEETDRVMYHETAHVLAAVGYKRYEISNFAQPGCESRHNLGTWTRQPYRGFGLGAHSFDAGDTTAPGGTRWHNTENMAQYLKAWGDKPTLESESGATQSTVATSNAVKNFQQIQNTRVDISNLTESDALAEAFILGLRLVEGVCLHSLKKIYGEKVQQTYDALLNELTESGLLEIKKERVRLTPLGTDLANQVMMRFI